MKARDRRYGKTTVKTRVGIATAILVGGAVAAGAALAANHGAAATATPAAFSSHAGTEGTVLSSAMTNWNGSRQTSYAQLARLTQARQFSQVRHDGKTLAVQRGIVVLATKKFLILRSSNGSLHLWLLSGKTKFQNVSQHHGRHPRHDREHQRGAAGDAVGQHDSRDVAAGRQPDHGRGHADPDPGRPDRDRAGGQHHPHRDGHRDQEHGDRAPDRDHAAGRLPAWSPVTFTQNAWRATHALARGDLALVVGTRSHWTLHARLVLFAPLSTAAVGGKAAAGNGATPVVMPTAVATHW